MQCGCALLANALLALGGLQAAAAAYCSASFTLSNTWSSGKGTNLVSLNVAVSNGQASIIQVPWTLTLTSGSYLSVQQVRPACSCCQGAQLDA